MKKLITGSVIAGALAIALCGSALEVAAQQFITGCVKPGTGLLRIPPSGEGCKAQETPLGFNDLPLLVALRAQVELLREEVTDLKQRLADVEACVASNLECNGE